MPVSDGFASRVHSGGYGYIMFDWINKHQWHAFSIYEDPQNPNNRRMFLAKNGDWTEKVHQSLQDRNTVRPVWISGPFPSPYNNAVQYDNMVLVASGIGITPALSAIEAYKDSRRVNLVWATRDAAMLVFFLQNAKLDHKGFNLVFYTGKDPLPDTIENFNVNANLQIIKERPNLSNILPNMIHYIDTHGQSQHEQALVDKDHLALTLLQQESRRSKSKHVSFAQRVSRLSKYANDLGYDMCELVKHEMTHAHPTEAAPGNLATIESDVDLEEAEAQAMLRKLDAMAATSPQKEPEAVFHSRNHHCSSASDHVVSPHHRHSVWKTNGSSSISASRKAKRVTFGDVEEGGMATSTNVWDENPAA